jgi:hypothetical protein
MPRGHRSARVHPYGMAKETVVSASGLVFQSPTWAPSERCAATLKRPVETRKGRLQTHPLGSRGTTAAGEGFRAVSAPSWAQTVNHNLHQLGYLAFSVGMEGVEIRAGFSPSIDR